jgi:hypothetical protein
MRSEFPAMRFSPALLLSSRPRNCARVADNFLNTTDRGVASSNLVAPPSSPSVFVLLGDSKSARVRAPVASLRQVICNPNGCFEILCELGQPHRGEQGLSGRKQMELRNPPLARILSVDQRSANPQPPSDPATGKRHQSATRTAATTASRTTSISASRTNANRSRMSARFIPFGATDADRC